MQSTTIKSCEHSIHGLHSQMIHSPKPGEEQMSRLPPGCESLGFSHCGCFCWPPALPPGGAVCWRAALYPAGGCLSPHMQEAAPSSAVISS